MLLSCSDELKTMQESDAEYDVFALISLLVALYNSE